MRYIATRSRVAKNEGMGHGLFGCLEPGAPLKEFQDWKDVARQVYKNSRRHVTMYRSVVSFAEETAKELLLTDQKAWQRYIENHIRTIAEKNGIRRENLRWAAAMHREKSHPHLHVVFWDNSDEKAKIRNPFTHPSVPDGIRRQMTKDTFAGRIRAYGEEKDKAVAGLREIGDRLVDDFERHIRLSGAHGYQGYREECGLDAELEEDFELSESFLNETAGRVLCLKAAIPPKGRIAYQFLPEEGKKQVDSLVAYLRSQVPELEKLRSDYVESKMKMACLYGGSDSYLASQRERFEAEADKVIANRILGMVKALGRLEDEGRAPGYRMGQQRHQVEQMVLEMLGMLSSMVDSNCQRYGEFEKAWGKGLSKEAKKELYLKYQDKGYEH